MSRTGKEYSMLFSINAQQGSNFTSTFSKSQKTLLELQKELQSLNKLQSDISAYQKQQGAVANTEHRLDLLRQQYDNMQKELAETGESSAALENKMLSKQMQIDRTQQSLDRQTQTLREMDAALRESGIDTDNLSRSEAQLADEINKVKTRQEEARDAALSFGEQSTQAISAVDDLITTVGIAAALKEIASAYTECIKVAGAFEESMSNVEALSGASASEMQQLSDLAKELGATTKFTAKESADAMGYMAMAGWDAQQMIVGMPGVLSLAAASG